MRTQSEMLESRRLLSASVTESEPNNTRATADAIQRELDRNVEVSGKINSSGDRDWFKIQLKKGDVIDRMTAGTGSDFFVGDLGIDTVDYSARKGDLTVSMGRSGNGEALPLGRVTLLSLLHENDFIAGPSFPGSNPANNQAVENIIGGSGDDVISAPAGDFDNKFIGNAGNDQLIGNGGKDILEGRSGDDDLIGGDGDDRLKGGAGDDVLDGGLGVDQLRGEDGDDVLLAADGAADSVLDGGEGFDILSRDSSDSSPIDIESLT